MKKITKGKIRVVKKGDFYPTHHGVFSGVLIYKGFIDYDWTKGQNIGMFFGFYFPKFKELALDVLIPRIERTVKWVEIE